MTIGSVYRAMTECPEYSVGNISAGKHYRLLQISHSHYDGASVFGFECVTTGERVAWWWFDVAADGLCEQNFERVSEGY